MKKKFKKCLEQICHDICSSIFINACDNRSGKGR